MQKYINLITVQFFLLLLNHSFSQHNPGMDCLTCHPAYKLGGTVFTDTNASAVSAGTPLTLFRSDGSSITIDNTNQHGNFYSTSADDGNYQIKLGNVRSKTWHKLPDQKSCNTCHKLGGNLSSTRKKSMHLYHTSIPSDNACTHCHHFPASMHISQVKTGGVLSIQKEIPSPQQSRVIIGSNQYVFDPAAHSISTIRPDIFAPGYFSMFDVILAVANANSIPIEYYWDDSCKTHWIMKINNVVNEYWYHWSYDIKSGNTTELNYRRANRWDEALWRPGVWIKIVSGENVAEIKKEYKEEITREKQFGHMIPSVRISINPTNYKGNPPGSGRITVSKEFANVQITPHNVRSTGFPSPYSKPFQPEVVTSMDILYSLMDQGKLNVVTGAFFNNFAQNHIDSYYMVEMGFPGIGTAHHSGRQGFVYTTENGAYNRLPNNADAKMHMLSDINVIHAPDFSYWRWIELGNPYYESAEPDVNTSVTDESVIEDYNSIDRGFNLHAPYPNPFNGSLNLSFNIFEPGFVNISIYNLLGQKITTLVDRLFENIGIQKLVWNPQNVSSGIYCVMMKYENSKQERRIIYLK